MKDQPLLETLLARCRQGDELAWEALVRQTQSRVYAVALQYTRSADDARDLAQDIFVKVYQKLDRFEGHETFLPWLMRLSRNAAVDFLRRRKARPPLRDVPVEDGPPLPDAGPSPDETADSARRRRLVHAALGRLSELSREVILMKDIQGLELREIADILGVPIGTVKSRSNRARLELAREIQAMQAGAGA